MESKYYVITADELNVEAFDSLEGEGGALARVGEAGWNGASVALLYGVSAEFDDNLNVSLLGQIHKLPGKVFKEPAWKSVLKKVTTDE